MLKPPRDAQEAFIRLVPDLEELTDFIGTSPLTAHERMRLANMLGEYFIGLAREHKLPDLRLVQDAEPTHAGAKQASAK